MNNLRGGRTGNPKGYTLFEITVTVILMAVIAGMALTNYASVGEKSRSSEGIQILRGIYEAQQLYILENAGQVAGNLQLLAYDFPTAGTRSFAGPVLFTANGQTAYIDRLNNHYRLYVSNTGDVTCDDAPVGLAGICAVMGIRPYPF